MSVKRAAIVIILIVLVTAAYVVFRVLAAGVVRTGSGGLGAVSFGVSEALIEAAVLAVVFAVAAYGWSWWLRRRTRGGPEGPPYESPIGRT